MKNIEKISSIKNPTPESLAPALLGIGVFGIGALVPINDALALEAEADVFGAAITYMTGGASTGGAAAAKTTALSMASIAAIVLVVAAVLFTIVYFCATSRKCVVLFLNELDGPLTFDQKDFKSGGPKFELRPAVIEQGMNVSGRGIFPGAGFIVADRRAGVYGTQFGISYKHRAHRFPVRIRATEHPR